MSAKVVTVGSANMTKDFLVSNKLGIHARPAAMFVTVQAQGHDASQALAELEILINRKFDED